MKDTPSDTPSIWNHKPQPALQTATSSGASGYGLEAERNGAVVSADSARVLRNTYGLLGLTLLFSAAVAAASSAYAWPAPGIVLTLLAYFGLFFLTAKLRNSGWGLVSTFALTGFMGYTIGPILNHYLSLNGGAQIVTMALGGTAAIFIGLSSYVLVTRRDFSFMGGFLMAGMVVAFLAGLGALLFSMPALSLAISAVVVLLMAGMILFETSRIIHGGETNYIMATIGLYLSIYNLFLSLLSLLGMGGSDE